MQNVRNQATAKARQNLDGLAPYALMLPLTPHDMTDRLIQQFDFCSKVLSLWNDHGPARGSGNSPSHHAIGGLERP